MNAKEGTMDSRTRVELIQMWRCCDPWQEESACPHRITTSGMPIRMMGERRLRLCKYALGDNPSYVCGNSAACREAQEQQAHELERRMFVALGLPSPEQKKIVLGEPGPMATEVHEIISKEMAAEVDRDILSHLAAAETADGAVLVNEKITIIFIVNGEDVPVNADVHAPLADARNKALADSHNTGRPPEEWEVRDERGVRLQPDQKVKAFSFPDRARLFLTLQIGVGGEGGSP